MKARPSMDSVFAQSVEDDLEFDAMFDYEDSLIDSVNGVNESGDPLTGVDFEDLHQTDDNASVKDVRDYGPEDNKMGAPDPEGAEKEKPEDNSYSAAELNKPSEGEKFVDGADDEHQDGKDNGCPKSVDPEHIEKNITAASESYTAEFERELQENRSYTAEFEREIREGSDVSEMLDGEEDDIDFIDNLKAPKTKLEYDPSDEDLILAAMGMN